MGAFSRFMERLRQSDEDRLAEELREWAVTVPKTVRIADVPDRARVRVAGMVRRITVRPVEGFEALEVVLWDGPVTSRRVGWDAAGSRAWRSGPVWWSKGWPGGTRDSYGW